MKLAFLTIPPLALQKQKERLTATKTTAQRQTSRNEGLVFFHWYTQKGRKINITAIKKNKLPYLGGTKRGTGCLWLLSGLRRKLCRLALATIKKVTSSQMVEMGMPQS